MKAWIIANGSIDNYDFYKGLVSPSDLIICADGGMRHAEKIGITPNIIIGDLDSISSHALEIINQKEIKCIKYPAQKDQTDTQLAVEYAITNGCEDIIIIGGIGTRFDHSFANISLLKMILAHGYRGTILSEYNTIYLIDSCINLEGNIGDIVSLLPLTEKVLGVTTKGLQYPLSNAEIILGTPVGVSNVFIEPQVTIRIWKGLLLIIKSKD